MRRASGADVDLDYVLEWDRVSNADECSIEGTCCTDLLNRPRSVLSDDSRWPSWLCTMSFYQESTRRWWRRTTLFDAPGRDMPIGGRDIILEELIHQSDMWPLPIGKEALERRWPHIVRGPDYVSLLSYLPFEGTEEAIWALRIEEGENILDLFGLADYYEVEQREMRVGLGDLRYVMRGRDMALLDYWKHAERWWSSWRGRGARPLGRPTGTGTWQSSYQCREALLEAAAAVQKKGGRVTQDRIADHLNCDVATLRRWLRRFSIAWDEVRRTS